MIWQVCLTFNAVVQVVQVVASHPESTIQFMATTAVKKRPELALYKKVIIDVVEAIFAAKQNLYWLQEASCLSLVQPAQTHSEWLIWCGQIGLLSKIYSCSAHQSGHTI